MATRRTRPAIAAGMTAVLAASLLTGCSSDEADGTDVDADYAQICRDPKTDQRIDDQYCEDAAAHPYHSGGVVVVPSWYWWPIARNGSYGQVPGVGQKVGTVTGGRTTAPTGSETSTRVSTKGGGYARTGSVSHGGFGEGGHGGEGGHAGS